MSLVELYSNILSNHLLLILLLAVPINYKEDTVIISPWAPSSS